MACKHRYRFCDQAHYVVCQHCGTYHSIVAPPPAEVYTADYWTHEHGHSTLEEQVYNCSYHEENGVTKNEFLFHRLMEWDSKPGDRPSFFEIGCAPGSFMALLAARAPHAGIIGCEMRSEWIPGIKERCAPVPVEVLTGPFPSVTSQWQLYSATHIIASDVFEHSHEPEAFLAECARLLRPGGQLLMMLPLAMDQLKGTRFFEPKEHVYIHSPANLSLMLTEAGFGPIAYDRWTLGHDTVSARRRGQSDEHTNLSHRSAGGGALVGRPTA